jgi:hypothetical protein
MALKNCLNSTENLSSWPRAEPPQMSCDGHHHREQAKGDDYWHKPDAPGSVVQSQTYQRHNGNGKAEAQGHSLYAINVVLSREKRSNEGVSR